MAVYPALLVYAIMWSCSPVLVFVGNAILLFVVLWQILFLCDEIIFQFESAISDSAIGDSAISDSRWFCCLICHFFIC